MLEARELTKSFGNVRALNALNVRIGAGEALCLLGANGAGKTTTINLFLAFIEPSSGSALVNGQNVQRDPIGSKRHLAYIPEQVALYPSLTGLENLEFLAELSGHRDYGADDLLRFLERAGLDAHAARRRVAEYSKGMRQTQSVIQLAIFTSLGLGLAGRVPVVWIPAGAALALVLQRYGGSWWLARHERGPAEWVWRRLTYGGGSSRSVRS